MTQLGGGVLKFSVLWRGKRTPRDRGAATFILLVYDVFGDLAPYTPSTRIQYDVYDVTSWAMTIGGKLPVIASQPITAIPQAVKGL